MRSTASLKFGGPIGGVVSGSCIALEIKRGRNKGLHLIDCGTRQSKFDYLEFLRDNRKHVVDPKEVDTIILTHLHGDHAGNVSEVTKEGFRGKIFCTKAGADMAEAIWMDAFVVSKREAEKALKKIKRGKQDAEVKKKKLIRRLKKGSRDRLDKDKRRLERIDNELKRICGKSNKLRELLLFDEKDVKESLRHIKNGGFEYFKWVELDKGVSLKMYPSGHMLGGAECVIRIKNKVDDKDPVYIEFTGDLGNKDNPILNPFCIVEEPIDWLIMESTYGGVNHKGREEEEKDHLAKIEEISRTGGVIIEPVYAIEKCQEWLDTIASRMLAGVIPTVPIWVDSPLAEKITKKYLKHWDDKVTFRKGGKKHKPIEVAIKKGIIKFARDKIESDMLSRLRGPMIIFAGSGSCRGGRVGKHLINRLASSINKVIFTSYIFKGTIGRKLKDGYKTVRINGVNCEVNAEISCFDGSSAHADHDTLVGLVESVYRKSPKLKGVFLIHGEEDRVLSLKKGIMETVGLPENLIVIPEEEKIYAVC